MKILRPSEVTVFPPWRDLTPEELTEAYRLARAAFTAEDLARYADLDEGVPADDVLRELKDAQRRHDRSQP
jgi:hypothetical protein